MKRTIFLFAFFCVAVAISAQSFEERYRAFQQQAIQQYEDFRAAANKSYADFMRSAWERFKAEPPVPAPHEDPVPPVPYEEPVVEPEPQPIPFDDEVTPPPTPEPQPEPVAPVIENDVPTVRTSINFYGTEMSFRAPKSTFHLAGVEPNQVADVWNTLANNDYDNLLYDCLQARSDYQLCDWAYLDVLRTLAESIYGATNEAVLLQAYLYANSGYQMRLARVQNRLYLLVSSKYMLYDRAYFNVNGTLFFPLENVNEAVVYVGEFNGEQAFSLQMPQEQRLVNSSSNSIQRRSKMGINTQCSINKNLIDFYNHYPTGCRNNDFGTRWEVYADAPMPDAIKQQLYPELMAGIRGVPEAQAVNKLLNWVQTAFEYEYDDKVWGGDRAFFPAESLYYPYCDCEDRAILFSRIVRDLLHLDVVLLYYPGHLASAVCFNQDVRGDYLVLNGRKFVVCDPTYIGASIGATMPGMDNKTAKVIRLQR